MTIKEIISGEKVKASWFDPRTGQTTVIGGFYFYLVVKLSIFVSNNNFMIHTVYIDDSSLKGKKLIHILQKEREIVRFENPVSDESQDGYMTSSEFRTSVKQGLNKLLK